MHIKLRPQKKCILILYAQLKMYEGLLRKNGERVWLCVCEKENGSESERERVSQLQDQYTRIVSNEIQRICSIICNVDDNVQPYAIHTHTFIYTELIFVYNKITPVFTDQPFTDLIFSGPYNVCKSYILFNILYIKLIMRQ